MNDRGPLTQAGLTQLRTISRNMNWNRTEFDKLQSSLLN
jgi:hypothetical protein